jgi:hypothetical protein
LIATPLPTAKAFGFADDMVTVTVFPLSLVDEIVAEILGQLAGSGMVLDIAVNASVAGLYNSAVLSAVMIGGLDGATTDRNDEPFAPPTISTWPSSAVPLPSIMVTVGPLRAEVILLLLPEPASVNALVLSL